jgi:hypothetical protein
MPREGQIASGEVTGLVVLVQYRLSEVVRPVNALVDRMLREGFATSMAILLLTFLLWSYVLRTIDRAGSALLSPGQSPTGGSVNGLEIFDQETQESPATLDFKKPAGRPANQG